MCEYPEKSEILDIFNNIFENKAIESIFDINQNEFKLKMNYNNKTITLILKNNKCNNEEFIKKI